MPNANKRVRFSIAACRLQPACPKVIHLNSQIPALLSFLFRKEDHAKQSRNSLSPKRHQQTHRSRANPSRRHRQSRRDDGRRCPAGSPDPRLWRRWTHRDDGLRNVFPRRRIGQHQPHLRPRYLPALPSPEISRDRCTTGYGACLIRYYQVAKDDLLIIFHNIGFNPTTIDAAEEAKNRGAKIIAVSSTDWQKKLPKDHHIRHPNGKHLFDYADLKIDDANPFGDADYRVDGFDVPIAPTSTIVDAYIAHRMVIEAVAEMKKRGIEPPIFRSANLPGGDEFNVASQKIPLPCERPVIFSPQIKCR